MAALPHVTALNETLTDRLTTIGSASSPFGSTGSSSSSSTNQTSLTSPVTIKVNQSNGSGPSLFVSGGSSSGFTLPTNFSPPITIIGTNDPLSINGTSLTISSGKAISGSSTADDAMVSTSMASKNNLKVGSTFTAYSQNLTVSAIFNGSSTNIAADDIIVSLPLEQSLSGQSGDVTSAVATIDSLTNLTSATNNIKSSLGSSATVTSSLEEAQATVSPLNNIKTITLYSLIGALIAAIVIIFLIMIMIVRERRREIGVLKAIGASNIKVVLQFMSEAITLTIAGSIIGIIIGVAASSPITHLLVTNETSTSTQVTPEGPVTRTGGFSGGGGFGGISRGSGNFTVRDVNRGAFGGIRNSLGNVQTVVGWSIVLYGVGAALVIAIIGSTASSLLISKIRPAEVMRVE